MLYKLNASPADANVESIVSALIYTVGMWCTGATIGQRAMGLRVTYAEHGQNVGIRKALLRYVV